MKEFFKKFTATDKMLHISVSALLVLAFGWISIWLGIMVAVACGLWKETVHDRGQGKGEYELNDFAADGIGIAVGLIISLLWIL